VSDASPRTTIHVPLGERSYDIVIGRGLLSHVAQTAAGWLDNAGLARRSAAVVTDANVTHHADVVSASLRDDGWNVEAIVVEPGETTKSLAVISSMYDRLVALQADRHTVVFAVGGGVVGDAAGFLAATYARGIPFVQVPTTLLADVDSSVGGKVGINHRLAKNLIGAFHQPRGVVIDTDALSTLPDREFRSGMAEVVKYGVILDAEFFARLEKDAATLNRRDPDVLRDVIARSCQLKADVVAEDEFERTGLRAVLNYGHTFAHAFEALSDYSQLLHGEAVSIGMVCASRLAERLERISADDTRRQISLLEALGLPAALKDAFPADEVIARMRLDKKNRGGKLRFVLPTRLGHVELVEDVPEADVRAVLV